MITKKSGLLNRARIVLTALVVLTGIGTTMMSMKMVNTYKYQVSETAGGQNWRVTNTVTSELYSCAPAESICTVTYDQNLNVGDLIPKDQNPKLNYGQFMQADN